MSSPNKLARELATIIGRKHVSVEIEDRILASYDATQQRALPDVVVKPANTAEVAGILKYATDKLVPVYARGAASGLTGGSVPVKGGIVLDLQRMNRILDIDAANLVAVVEPAVTVGDFQRAAAKKGLLYPPDPSSADFSTIGGNVAECAGGLRAMKYGVTRDYVLGLEVVLADGEIIHTGTKTLKSVTGYDITRLFVGSEGTLGVFTRIILRLLPLPPSARCLLAYFRAPDEAAATVTAIIERRLLPTAIEFIDRSCADCVRSYRQVDVPEETGALLLIEVDGDEESTARSLAAVREVCEASGAFQVSEAKTAEERETLWEMRRAVSPALYTMAPNKLNEDICVMPSLVPELLHCIGDIAKRHDVFIANFGHIGEGNVHMNVMYHSDETSRKKAEAAVAEVMKELVAMGGTLSGEHGIGITKAEFLDLEIGPRELSLMLQLKKVFDPNGILNPGKIFSDKIRAAHGRVH